jgi:hypothetical protein
MRAFLLPGLLALMLTAPARQESPPAKVALSDVDFSVVSAPAVIRLADSLRLATTAFFQYCSTRGAPAYVRRGCEIQLKVQQGYDQLYATRFVILREGPLMWHRDGPDSDLAGAFTRCGKVHMADHSERLVWPPARWWPVGNDSSRWVTRFGNPLGEMCSSAFPGPDPVGPSAANSGGDSVLVTWRGAWILEGGRRVYRPVFDLPAGTP